MRTPDDMAAREREAELTRTKEALDRRAEELARTRSLMRATMESVSDAILVTDASGTVLDLNKRFLQMWGIPKATAVTREPGRILMRFSSNFTDPAAARRRVEEIYATSPESTFETVELADGRIIEQSTRLQLLLDERVGRVWIFRDVTEQKRVEGALRDETRVLEILNETGALLASQLDLPGLLQALTDATTKLSGAKFGAFFYTGDHPGSGEFQIYTLSGAPKEAFDKLGHPRATPIFKPTLDGNGAVRSDDIVRDPRYGHWPPHHGMPEGHLPVRSYLAVPVRSRSGDVLGGLFFGHPEPAVFNARSERIVAAVAAQAAVAIDNARLFEDARRAASERADLLDAERAARAEIEHVSLMKDEFLATLSHELRTPLNAVLGWSDILLHEGRKPEDLRRGLQAISRNARAQAQLIDDLLDMSRIVAGKVRLEVKPTELAAVVDSALEAVRLSADAKQIQLRKIVDPTASAVGDPNRLQQVIWNLLSNAVKFTPKGGSVQVQVARVESHVEISVSDTGAGISPAFLPHVFERFRQADASTTRQHGGLGLGLAIVKQLVELHGGSVEARSEGDNRGSTFVVRLPLGAVGQDRAPRDGGSRDGVDLDGVRVVVVDDDADARDLISWVLADVGAQAAVAASADEGLRLVRELRPHVLVSDIGMPHKDGYELIREVRALPFSEGGHTPAIALTAFARSEDRTRALLAGYQLHLSKPVEPSELLATVASLAGRTTKRS
jgi:PAS domain S-box-containing protein